MIVCIPRQLPKRHTMFSSNQIAVCLKIMNFYFINTANIPVYGNFAVYRYVLNY